MSEQLGPDDVAAVLDFTEEELATLRRFQFAPNLEEQVVWNRRPLVPSGPLQYAGDLVPAPENTPEGVDVGQWAAHYLADSLAEQMLGRYFVGRVDVFHAPVAEVQEMVEAYDLAGRSFLIGFLLRHVDAAVAHEAMQILDAGEQGEWAWQWLVNAGIDPHRIKTPRTQAERLAYGEQVRACRAAERADRG